MSTPQQPPPPIPGTGTGTSTGTSTGSTSSTTASTTPAVTSNPQASTEQLLREELHKLRKKILKREPLDPSYNFLLTKNSYLYVKPPKIHKDKLYKKFGANLWESVSFYMNKYGTETPVNDARKETVGRHRASLDEGKMRDAFTIRECKEHEQKDLIKASLLAENARRRPGSLVDEGTRKRSVEAMALGLQERERKKKQKEIDRKLLGAAKQKMLNAEKKLLEMQRAKTSNETEAAILEEKLRQTEKLSKDVTAREVEDRERTRAIEMTRAREKEREKERLAAEKRDRERIKRDREVATRRARQMETPQQALHRLYEPILTSLWDMEFEELNQMNPFRIVIDKSNCAAMGAPDYCEVIEKPMNLTYMREKVNAREYLTLQGFFGDVELLINNALLYNSDPNNVYHIAAIKMKNKYIELRKKLMLQIEATKTA